MPGTNNSDIDLSRSPPPLGDKLASAVGAKDATPPVSTPPRSDGCDEAAGASTDVSTESIPVYVVPSGGSRRGAAIFANWSDCEFYLQDQVDLTYRRFLDMEAAVKYFHPLIASQSMKRPRSTSVTSSPPAASGPFSPSGSIFLLCFPQ